MKGVQGLCLKDRMELLAPAGVQSIKTAAFLPAELICAMAARE